MRKGNHSKLTVQDLYYDGYGDIFDTYDEYELMEMKYLGSKIHRKEDKYTYEQEFEIELEYTENELYAIGGK